MSWTLLITRSNQEAQLNRCCSPVLFALFEIPDNLKEIEVSVGGGDGNSNEETDATLSPVYKLIIAIGSQD